MPRALHEVTGPALPRAGYVAKTKTGAGAATAAAVAAAPAAAAAAGEGDRSAVADASGSSEWEWLAEASLDLSFEETLVSLSADQQEAMLTDNFFDFPGPLASQGAGGPPLDFSLPGAPNPLLYLSDQEDGGPPSCGGPLEAFEAASPMRTPGKNSSNNRSSSSSSSKVDEQGHECGWGPPLPPQALPWGGDTQWILNEDNSVRVEENGCLAFRFPQSGCTYTTAAANAAAEAAAKDMIKREAAWTVTCSSSSSNSSSSNSSSSNSSSSNSSSSSSDRGAEELLLKRVSIPENSGIPAWLLHCICLAQHAAAAHAARKGDQQQQQQQQQQQADRCSSRLLLPVFDVHIAANAAYFVLGNRGVSLGRALLQQGGPHAALRCSCCSLRIPTNSSSSSSSSSVGCAGCPRRFLWLLLCGLEWMRRLRLLPAAVSPASVYLVGPCPLRLYVGMLPMTPDSPLLLQQLQQQQQQGWLAQQLPPSCWLPPEKRSGGPGTSTALGVTPEVTPEVTPGVTPEAEWGASHYAEENEPAVIWGAGICFVAHLLLQQHQQQQQHPQQQQQQQQQWEFKREVATNHQGSKAARVSLDAAAAAAEELPWQPGDCLAIRRRRSCGLPEGLLLLQQQDGLTAAAAAASQELVETCEGTAAGDSGRLPASLLAAAAAGAAPFMSFDSSGSLSSSKITAMFPTLEGDTLGVQLLQQLLHASPRLRISLADALAHPWFRDTRQGVAAAAGGSCCSSSISSRAGCAASEWLAELAEASQHSWKETEKGDESLQEVLEKMGLSPTRRWKPTNSSLAC